ncbi:MAG: response regulator [Chloroflexi bacterium]|jgi:DNA-binding response OmpR family regulator|nr:response regulator [Chloroflexota bacterium]
MTARILIVDDDPLLIELFSILLKAHGYEVLRAGNGVEALEKIEKENPDLILLDLMMPDMDGIEVCRRVRAQHQVPILIISALDHPGTIAEALDAGADDYLVKPVPGGVLLARVARLLWRARAAQSPEPQRIEEG